MACKYTQICPVTFGAGAIETIGEEGKRLSLKKVILVTDAGVKETGMVKRVEEILEKAGIQVCLFDKVEMDAPDYTITEGAKLGKEERVDGVVGFGGGSSLDSAKAIASLIPNLEQADINALIRFQPEKPVVLKAPLPNIMVPTTSGTGSEVTCVAVIGDTERRKKAGCLVFPNAAIVDPELTLGLAPEITAYTGMDAFSHASEALASVGINPHSDLLALDAIRRIVEWLPVAVKEPENYTARENLALASNFAGKAFQDSTVNVGHSIAHALGAAYHIPHGIGCALATPVVLERVASSRPEIFFQVAEYLGVPTKGVEETHLGKDLADAMRAFIYKIGIPSLKKLGIAKEQCLACTEEVIGDGMRRACLVPLSEEDIQAMMADLYDKYE